MIDLSLFQQLRLLGGFVIRRLDTASTPMVDAMGRQALAHTSVEGRELTISIVAGLNETEMSVTIYHEVLEGAAMCNSPPASVEDFNEGAFELAGYQVHDAFGLVSPDNLNRMLQFYGFRQD